MAEQAEPIVIKNDGSFLEQFLKLQQAGVAEEAKVSLVSAADDDKHNEVVKEESEEDIDGEPLESVNNDGSLSTENSRTQQGVQDAGAVEDSGARRDEKAQTPPCDVQSGADSEQNKKRGPFARLGKAPFASVWRGQVLSAVRFALHSMQLNPNEGYTPCFVQPIIRLIDALRSVEQYTGKVWWLREAAGPQVFL
jgi:hypothetical protein